MPDQLSPYALLFLALPLILALLALLPDFLAWQRRRLERAHHRSKVRRD